MTENGLFFLGGPETRLHDILWAIHDRKNRGGGEGEENIRGSRLQWVVGAERCTEGLHVSLIDVRAWVRGVGL